MRLIPPVIDRETPSEGEKHLFELFAADTTHPDWTVLHSLDIARHRRQMEGEIDFLVVAPRLGALVLEVKGCHRLRRSHGLWYYGSDGNGHSRSPFRQASEAMHSLHDRLLRRHRHLSGVLFWSAVCLPFIDFTDESEEWQPWQVIDKGKLSRRSLSACLESVLEQARERAAELHKAWFDPEAHEPTPEQCAEIVQALRPDFEFFESPKARARRVDAEILHYTEQQFDALDHMRRTARVVFDGPAGTGKTLLALEAARRARAEGKNVLLLCFNRPLALWLEDQARELANGGQAPLVAVRTIHYHMTELTGSQVKSSPADGAQHWEHGLPEAAAERLLANWDAVQAAERDDSGAASEAHRLGIFDELVVDEAQDVLRASFLDVLDLSLRGGLKEGTWRMFGDFAGQAIYDDVSLDGFCSAHGGGCTVYPLDENCRNSPRVAEFACELAGLEGVYRRVLRPDDGIDPEIRVWRTKQEQSARLVEVLEELRGDGFTGPQVAVLSMHKDADSAAASLTGLPWCDRLEPLGGDEAIDLRSGRTHYASIYRFKGLEARAVVLTDIDRLDKSRDRALVYVGATRATQRLVVLAHESVAARLRHLAAKADSAAGMSSRPLTSG
jgi:DNA polymerase III delta prime subunit